MKIERVKIASYNNKTDWKDFVKTLRALKVGESFLMNIQSNHRMAISLGQDFLDARFITRKEGTKHRIARIS